MFVREINFPDNYYGPPLPCSFRILEKYTHSKNAELPTGSVHDIHGSSGLVLVCSELVRICSGSSFGIMDNYRVSSTAQGDTIPSLIWLKHRVANTKFLGVIFQENLSWKYLIIAIMSVTKYRDMFTCFFFKLNTVLVENL